MKQTKRKPKTAPPKQAPESAIVPDVAPVVETPPATASVASESSFALGSLCTMREAAAIKVELLKLLRVKQTVLLDVSAVERIDTSALQLLCAFIRDRRARRLATRWQGKAPAFVEAVEILGLGQALSFQPDQRAA